MDKIYARERIHAIGGYTPGEQLTGRRIVKLNTNENPYPPSPVVAETLRNLDWEALRRYPEPTGRPVREAAAKVFGIPASRILCGNGSDDLLTIALRTFVGEGDAYAYPEPSYSLYPVLADLQGAVKRPFQLDENFELPPDLLAQAIGAAALADQAWLHSTCAKIRDTRERTAAELAKRGWRVLPSQANFLLAKPAFRPAPELFAALREKGLLVRYFALPRVDEFLRITIGTDDEMRELLDALAELDR